MNHLRRILCQLGTLALLAPIAPAQSTGTGSISGRFLSAVAADPPLILDLTEAGAARYTRASMPVKVALENVSNEPLRILSSFGKRHALRVFFRLDIRSTDGRTNTTVGGGKIDLPMRSARYVTLKKGEK